MKSALVYVDTLLNDLLDFSRLEGGQLPIEKKPFHLPKLLNSIFSQYEDIPDKKNIAFTWMISPQLHTPIVSDPVRLSQVLNNLIGNAFKYTRQGYVKVDTSIYETSKSPFLKIKVIDTGIGIKKEKQALIFKEFIQADDSIYGEYGGYGLGLTIAQKISALLGGYLELESVEHKGSTFSLYIPLEFGTLEEPLSKYPLLNANSSPLSVLIFEDDKALLELLLAICKSQNIQATGFTSFQDSETHEALQYELVLTDINLPDIDGFEILKKLKSRVYPHYKNQPIIAMTGQRNIDRSEYIIAGFSEVLSKPFSAETLLDTFQTLCSDNPSKVNIRLNENVTHSQSLFNLGTIASFVENQEALESVLATFLQNTSHHLETLDHAFSQNDLNTVRNIAHQMLPMFRQLEVKATIPILERMEVVSKKSDYKEAKEEFAKLKRIFLQLKKEFHAQLFTHPIGTS